MGRREIPLDSACGRLYDFALALRELRTNARLTYRQMAEITHYSASTFARAANGRALPPLDVTIAYVKACGGDTGHWRRLWEELAHPRDEAPADARRGPPVGAQRPVQVVPDITDFVGRATQLAGAERALADGANLIIVSGPPGVGKTAFAVRLAHRVRERFPDGQLYVQLAGHSGDRPGPAAALARLLRGLGEPTGSIPAHVDESAARYRSRLAGRRCLVLLDGVHDEAEARPLLAGAPCAVIVTSQNVLAGLAGAHRVVLDSLSDAEALEMLATIAGLPRVLADSRQARAVTRLCGRLPLAIQIAGARLVTRPGWTLTHLRARLDGERDRLHELAVGDLAVRATFERSYRRLPADSRAMFRRLALLPGPHFSAHVVAALGGARHRPDVALQRLVDASLVAATPAGDHYAVPDLLRIFAAECARADSSRIRERIWRRIAMWYARSAMNAADATRLPPRTLRVPAGGNPAGLAFDDEQAAVAWLGTEGGNLVAAARLAARTGPRSASWLIADAMRGYLQHTRQFDDLRVVTEAGLTAALAAREPRAIAAMQIARYEVEDALGGCAGPEVCLTIVAPRRLVVVDNVNAPHHGDGGGSSADDGDGLGLSPGGGTRHASTPCPITGRCVGERVGHARLRAADGEAGARRLGDPARQLADR
jgi:hypothetical protein